MFHRQRTTAATLTAPPSPGPEHQRLTVHRHDRRRGTLIALAGEIDLDSAPFVHQAVQGCLHAGIRTIDLDLNHVTFCDISGLNALLDATWLTTADGGRLRLENPCPMLSRLLALTGAHLYLATRTDGIRDLLQDGAPIDRAVRGRFLPQARAAGAPDDQ
ncbi:MULTISPECIES: STAS domain-containing protein [unclassified Streptomyces]|uniref:STAS domain-containing protein n=1 Tax=unclassified Streptomyces TaxID=2593676 RepID=UPI0022AE8BEB|nr:STAS domain-containing protein [Streptomyces sp. H39-C1]MCZ4098934.1 STAS domain-containing protein [Streptomyces sp. H39-C1]